MGNKYKINKTDVKSLFASADVIMEDRYHELYIKLGLERGRSGNFHCFNANAHGRMSDENPSLSIDNRTGKWRCFSCGIKGNFQSYFTNFLKGSQYGDSYTDFIIDFLDMAHTGQISFINEQTDPNYQQNRAELHKLYEMVQRSIKDTKGGRYLQHGDLSKMIKSASTLPIALLDKCVNNLLNNNDKLQYLKETRNIDVALIKRYRIGLDGKGRFVFPIISAEGDLINIKCYDPQNPNSAYKWNYPYSGHETRPTPIDNFTHQKIFFFEGEPDCYCAISFGMRGAVTIGGMASTDIDKIFGIEQAKQIFYGKEIVICFDSDDAGRSGAINLAKSIYQYCKQVKIIDLDMSDINPNGLDPNNTKTVTINDKNKTKRIEKDYTDWMKKNGFNEQAQKEFELLIEKTKVYTINEHRNKETCKVTLQEARMSRYYSANGEIELDLIASVADFNCNALMYPVEFSCKCRCMNNASKLSGACAQCVLPLLPGFGQVSEMTFSLVRNQIPKDHTNNPFYNIITDHEVLGLVEVTELQKVQHQKKLVGIHDKCRFAVISDLKNEKLLHVNLSQDINEFHENNNSDIGRSSIEMDAYMMGDMDIYPNQSYKFIAHQTTAWNGQQAVLFIEKAEPIATSIEKFQMSKEIHDILTVFQPKENESIAEHLRRRYDVFGNAAGITGRRDVFFINDLVFFSPVTINNKKLLPQITRGWVEALIAGDPRCGKTLISNFFHNHYKAGEIVSGSSAISRTGLLGGIRYFGQRANISWGKIATNDGGMLIIDELSNIDPTTLSDLTSCRSDGMVEIGKIKAGKAPARTRKIMLSNQRVWKSEDKKEYSHGIEMLRDLCIKDEILARFDIAHYLKEGDVDASDFSATYDQISTEFTEYQCQSLIRWAWSRKPEDIVFEEGIEHFINEAQIYLLKKFHPSTQLINREMRAKLIRMSTSAATMTFSIYPGDYNKVYVQKKHLDFIVNFLIGLYCSDNLKMDSYSEKKRNAEQLGNMEFMASILKHIDINALLQEEEYSERAIYQVFYDYLDKVARSSLYMVDSRSDKIRSTGLKPYEGIQKLIGTLVSRNCFSRTKRGTYKKTLMFNKWISDRLELGENASFSNLLEPFENQQYLNIVEKARQNKSDSVAA